MNDSLSVLDFRVVWFVCMRINHNRYRDSNGTEWFGYVRYVIIWQTTHRYDQHIPWAEDCRLGRRSSHNRTVRRSFHGRSGRRRLSERPGRTICWPPLWGRSSGDSGSMGRQAGRRRVHGSGRQGRAGRWMSAGGYQRRQPGGATPHRTLRDTDKKQSQRMRKLVVEHINQIQNKEM